VSRAKQRRQTGDNAWLAQVEEEILEPSLAICDAHHHLWPQPDAYLLPDLLADTGSGHRVVSTVFVECGAGYRPDGPPEMSFVGETDFIEPISAATAGDTTHVAAAIVARADLSQGDAVRPVLEAHQAASPGHFVGIRHVTAVDPLGQAHRSHTFPPEGLMADSAFRAGFAQLAELSLCFDAWLYHSQLDELTELADSFPSVTIVLDHFGGPLGIGEWAKKRDEVFTVWRRAIVRLAECPNVVVKLGGLAMPVNGFGWHERERPPTSEELAAATRDYYLHSIDCFGPDRCMFESNFPVDRISCSYPVLWNSFKRLVADFAPADKAALFHDTADRVYRLG
jgi:predicted TIM-barrel fold metal-dependent hydrolase